MAESTDLAVFTAMSGRDIENDLQTFTTEEECVKMVKKLDHLTDRVLSVSHWIEGKIIQHMRTQLGTQHPASVVAAEMQMSPRLLRYCEPLCEAFTLEQVKAFHDNGYQWTVLRETASRSISDDNRQELIDEMTHGRLSGTEIKQLASEMQKAGPGNDNELGPDGASGADDDDDDNEAGKDAGTEDDITGELHDTPPDFHDLISQLDDADSVCISVSDTMDKMTDELCEKLADALNYIPGSTRAVNQTKQLQTHIRNLNEDMTRALTRLIRGINVVHRVSRDKVNIKDVIRGVLDQLDDDDRSGKSDEVNGGVTEEVLEI